MTMTKWASVLAMGLLVAAGGCAEQRSGTAVQESRAVSLLQPDNEKGTPQNASLQKQEAATQGTAAASLSLSATGQPVAAQALVLSTPEDVMSYSLGVQMVRGYQKQEIKVDPDNMVRGFKDAQAGKEAAETGEVTETVAAVPAPKSKIGYSAGYAVAKALIAQEAEVNWDALARGMKDVLNGNELLLPDDGIKAAMESFTAELIMKRRAAYTTQAMDNKKAGEEFLAANKTQKGVVTLPNGLQYKVIKMGSGPKPTAADTVEVNYRGTLIDGTEFLNTYSTHQPAVLKLSDPIIVGLKEALKMMPGGSKWQLFIPARLGYLWRGMGRQIGPNATLIYELDLIDIKTPPAPTP
jgi:FKBP-type peptidyl-prolyl cis-trans isomerase FklB